MKVMILCGGKIARLRMKTEYCPNHRSQPANYPNMILGWTIFPQKPMAASSSDSDASKTE